MQSSSPEAAAYDRWAEYYDLLDADRAPFISFYTSLVGERTKSILDLGCGTGTITLAVARSLEAIHGAKHGTRLVGVDGSARMLDVARSRDAGIDWRFGDIRSPPVEGEFDLVICCFNTFQHLLLDQDLERAFTAVHALLAPGGIFAFDMYQPNLAYLEVAQQNRLARSITDPEGRHLEIREDMLYDAGQRVLDLNWRLVDRDQPDAPLLASTSYRLRQHFAADVVGILANAGLAVRERYGDFDRSPFTATSKKQVLICGRA